MFLTSKKCVRILARYEVRAVEIHFKLIASMYLSKYYSLFAGPNGGLIFGIEFDPNEWTSGPHFYGEGFRIAIHKPGTSVYSLAAEGISLRKSLTSEIGLTRKEDTFLVTK